MEKQFIEKREYKRLGDNVRYHSKKVEDIIDVYEYLKDKRTEEKHWNGEVEQLDNLHLKLLSEILFRTESTYADGFSEFEEEFLKSEYLSDQLKIEISGMLKNRSQELTELVNSDKNISDFSKEELKRIIDLLESIGNSLEDNEKWFYGSFCRVFREYLFELDGKGPVEYIKEKYGDELPVLMLKRSNVSEHASYYSGYGVSNGMLGDKHLFSLYKKFVKFYPDDADSFVKFVMSLSNLAPTEFVTNYLSFVSNGLSGKYEKRKGGFSFEGVYGGSKIIIGVASIASSVEKTKNTAIDMLCEEIGNKEIKRGFKKKIEDYKKRQEAEKASNSDAVVLGKNNALNQKM